MKTSFASLIAFLCGVFPAFGQREAAFHARFDGTLDVNGAPPVKTANLTFSDGVDGQAVYVPTNGWLEYSFSSDYLKSESGTVLFWAKTDWAYTGCCTYRDHALTDDGIWGDLRASQLNRSFFLLGSWRGIRLSTSSTFECWYVEAWGGAGTRGRIQPDEWHQYALSFDRKSGRFRAYIDGHLLGDKLFPKPVEGIFPKTFTVGCGGERGGNLGPRLGLSGAMDELRLYPCELTPDEVLADYTRHVPYRMELLDWTVGEGETRKVRLRVRNITTAPITRTFAFNTGDTVSLTLSPDELKEFSVTVRGEKPGLFALECNKGKSDYRQFKMDCLAVIQPSTLNPQLFSASTTAHRTTRRTSSTNAGRKSSSIRRAGPTARARSSIRARDFSTASTYGTKAVPIGWRSTTPTTPSANFRSACGMRTTDGCTPARWTAAAS